MWWFWLMVFSGRPQLILKVRNLPTAAFMAIVTIVKLTAKPCSVVSLVALWLFAWPEQYPPKDERSFLSAAQGFNVFDDVLCRDWLWRGFCRRLEVRGATLLRSGTDLGTEGLFDEFDGRNIEFYYRLYGLDLTNRSLRYADLTGAYLLAAKLSGADLRGAVLVGAELHGADLTWAKLHGAQLMMAELHGAQLQVADLHGARLIKAELHGADLTWAKLYGADLSAAELHGAYLSNAELHGADLTGAELHGAVLIAAKLHGAELAWAELVGARLSGTALCGATLTDVLVVGAVGRPETDLDADLGSIVWKPDELPQLDAVSCSEEGPVRCHMQSRRIPSDLPMAWRPDMNLMDHLLTYVDGAKSRPGWLTASDAAGASSNECH